LRRAIELEILMVLCELPATQHQALVQRLQASPSVQEAVLKPLHVAQLVLADQAAVAIGAQAKRPY
jgi:hypothetical protein